MADLKAQFEQAVAESKSLPEKPDNMTLLKIYALYKQAQRGDVEGKRPGFTDMVGPRQVGRVERAQGQERRRGDAGVRRPDRVAEVAALDWPPSWRVLRRGLLRRRPALAATQQRIEVLLDLAFDRLAERAEQEAQLGVQVEVVGRDDQRAVDAACA